MASGSTRASARRIQVDVRSCVIAGGRATEPKPPGLSLPSRPNDLWCADYKGEFMLADRRYSYPVERPAR